MSDITELLQALTRDELLEFAEQRVIEVTDRRAKAPLVAALAKLSAEALTEILGTLPRARLKELCGALELDDSGKEKAPLVERLVAYAKPRSVSRAPKPAPKPSEPPPKPVARSVPPAAVSGSAPMTMNISQLAAYIWNLADLLRGDFKQSQYGRIILPFTILRRLECVLEGTKDKVLKEAEKRASLPEEAREKFLRKAAEQSFYNTSPMDLSKLGSTDIKSNLLTYVQSFSRDAREIFEHFRFDEFVHTLSEANLLFKVVQKVAATDLHPETVSNHEMGLVFEELIRRFAEGSNETAGEHFTPRDIVRLTTSLVFMEDDEALRDPGIIRTIYDPTAGTGGFLSSGMEYVFELNPQARIVPFGQELNPESYAICKGDMLIKGQEVQKIKLGNTLSDDQLPADRFDYMLSNPPFGVDWKKIEEQVNAEYKVKGFDGRFGPGLPRVSDGSLLFLLHLISKMRDYDPKDPNKNGGRIGIILNGSPLFTGGAGSGESEIRRYILEQDLLEAIVALPTDLFYNTGIATYVWVLSNKKQPARKGQVQLINAVHCYQKMRKSLGSKRQYVDEEQIALITKTFGNFEPVDTYGLNVENEQSSSRGRPTTKKADKRVFGCKIFRSHEFGYRRITIERPLRLSLQFSPERLAALRFDRGQLGPVMQRLYEAFGQDWTPKSYGDFEAVEPEVRALIKAEFPDLKEKHRKDVLNPKLWQSQRALLEKAQALGEAIGPQQLDDYNAFDALLSRALKQTGLTLDTSERNQLEAAITWTNPDAEPVIKKVVKGKPDPLYGTFEYKGQVVTFQPDSNLRDNEDVPLTAETARGGNVDAENEAYFKREVAPHVKDAWIDGSKKDERDNGVGIVGYEIPFNRHFYQYEPPRSLEEIDADLDVLSGEIMEMLREVHS
jgi:type I restriction enzyme M protein